MHNDSINNWSRKKLGDENYFKLIMGQSPPSSTYNDQGIGIPFFQGKAEFGELFPVPKKFCSKPNRIAKKKDVLISIRAPVGPTNLADQTCCIGRGLAAIRCTEKVLPRFLLYTLRSMESSIAESVQDQGGGFTAINRDQLMSIEILIPPLKEQCRIVSRIEEMNARSAQVRQLKIELEKDLALFMKATYYRMIEGVEWKPLKEVASLVRREIHIKPDEEYEEMGVRSFGKGTFRKPILTGRQIGSKRIYRIHERDLVFNNVFAWEGAIAVAQPEDHGRVGSHRFITYVPHQGKATSEFLCYHFLSEKGIEDICAASPGSAGRNRTLGLEKLKIINVPVPDYQKQLGFAEIAKRRHQIQRESISMRQELLNFESVVVEKAFRGEL